MKWYTEFLIVWIITVLVFFLITFYRNENAVSDIIFNLLTGTFLSAMAYAGYKSAAKKKH
jgi:hypothetical protein